jgi:hypothetical protein
MALMQAIKLLLMYGAEVHHANKFKQIPERLCTDEGCLKVFSQLKREGDLCRQEMRERLHDCRQEKNRSAQLEQSGYASLCVSLPFRLCHCCPLCLYTMRRRRPSFCSRAASGSCSVNSPTEPTEPRITTNL